jgi:hypothetical protein
MLIGALGNKRPPKNAKEPGDLSHRASFKMKACQASRR